MGSNPHFECSLVQVGDPEKAGVPMQVLGELVDGPEKRINEGHLDEEREASRQLAEGVDLMAFVEGHGLFLELAPVLLVLGLELA